LSIAGVFSHAWFVGYASPFDADLDAMRIMSVVELDPVVVEEMRALNLLEQLQRGEMIRQQPFIRY
jgi:hypothetical protein